MSEQGGILFEDEFYTDEQLLAAAKRALRTYGDFIDELMILSEPAGKEADSNA